MKEKYKIQPSDSLSNISTTIPIQNQPDTARHLQKQIIPNAPTHSQVGSLLVKKDYKTEIKQVTKALNPVPVNDTLTINDTIVQKETLIEPEFNNFALFPTYARKDSSLVAIKTNGLETTFQNQPSTYSGAKSFFLADSGYKSWILLLVIFCTFILILIRTGFQKYFESVINSLLNYQLAEKLMREKNVLIRRAFLLLNLNYFISSGLFFYLIVFRYNLSFLGLNEFGKFFVLLLSFFLLLQLRLFFMQIIGKIFNSRPVFKEYIHSSYLLNKNLGIYLLPVVFSSFFIVPGMSNFLFYLAIFMILISLIIKYIRTFQIILKHKVF
jgi:hypothetical protein